MNIQPLSTQNTVYRPLPLKDIKIYDGFWSKLQRLVRETSIPHAYEMFHTHGYFENLKTAANLDGLGYHGRNFLDSDLYKWIEAAAYSLTHQPDPALENHIDDLVALIARVQMEDGYINSYYQSMEPNHRWHDLDHGHELYVAGHLFEAAVALKRAIGNSDLMVIAEKFADHIYKVFITQNRSGAPGHPEIEHALVELYRETGKAKYLQLSLYFLNERGQCKMVGLDGIGPEYHQDHLPVRQADKAVGHAVRQLYLVNGMIDAYIENGDHALLLASERIWGDVHSHKTFLNGSFGSRFQGESFGEPYELPSDLCYCETCTTVANMMWNWRLLTATGKAKYAEAIEQSLYNGFLSGLGLDGTHFFYVNPLQTRIGAERQPWFEVACCPPNMMRQIMGLGQYIATTSHQGIQIHQYAGVDLTFTVSDHSEIQINMDTQYPWDGDIMISIQTAAPTQFDLALRIPCWVESLQVWVNNVLCEVSKVDSYIHIRREWLTGDSIRLLFPLQTRIIHPNPRIDAVRGCVALQRGPLLYCLEGCDCEADPNLLDIRIDPEGAFQEDWCDRLGGVVNVTAKGEIIRCDALGEDLYFSDEPMVMKEGVELNAIPYYAWANRGKHAMRVWIPKKE